MKFTGNITPTKIMAAAIFIGSVACSLALSSEAVLIFGTSVAGGLLGWRKHEQRKIITKK